MGVLVYLEQLWIFKTDDRLYHLPLVILLAFLELGLGKAFSEQMKIVIVALVWASPVSGCYEADFRIMKTIKYTEVLTKLSTTRTFGGGMLKLGLSIRFSF